MQGRHLGSLPSPEHDGLRTHTQANDAWIAALADGCTLVTNNLREFERVAGLRLENWASEVVPPLGA